MPRPKATERRQLFCSWCSQVFSKQEHLARHVRSHTLEKPFACNVCKKSFGRSDTLLRHARGHRNSMKDGPHEGAMVVPRRPSQASEPGSSIINLGDTMTVDGAFQQQLARENLAVQFDRTRISSIEDISGSDWRGEDLSSSSVFEHSGNMDPPLRTPTALNHIGDVDMTWNLDTIPRTPVWLAGSGFDLGAVNSAIMGHALDSLGVDLSLAAFEDLFQHSSVSETSGSRKEEVVRRQWFTYLESHSYDSLKRETNGRTKIDERYRADLSQRLHIQAPYEPLPSTDFLNLCVQMYFNRFNPVFPIVHPPTFRPSNTNSLLLLSICAIGSSFLGCPQATRQGQSIFERLNKAIMASWEAVISDGQSDALALIQAILVVQTFGMLSGRPRSLLLAQSFHGTIITWAKRSGVFQLEKPEMGYGHANNLISEEAWEEWVQEEQKARVTAALYIHDAELSLLFNSDPVMRHSASKLPSICPNSVWMASTAQAWKSALNNSSKPDNAPICELIDTGDQTAASPIAGFRPEPFSFRSYCELEGIAASINEAKDIGPWPSTRSRPEMSLLLFYKKNLPQPSAARRDLFCLDILWHSIYISLFADLDRLEMAAGRDGLEKSQRHAAYAKSWSCSPDATRCALHGMMILKKAESLPIGTEPAIHVPRVLYTAAMIWYCYTQFGQSEDQDSFLTADTFPEFKTLGLGCQNLLFEAHGFRATRPSTLESMTLVSLIDLMRRIGHFEISDRMATLMTSIVHGSPDGESPVLN